MNIRCRLKAVLADVGMNQGEFAKVMGVSTATVSAWTQGKTIPNLETAYAIEEVTGFDLKQIWVKED